jgi:hypothetical protein
MIRNPFVLTKLDAETTRIENKWRAPMHISPDGNWLVCVANGARLSLLFSIPVITIFHMKTGCTQEYCHNDFASYKEQNNLCDNVDFAVDKSSTKQYAIVNYQGYGFNFLLDNEVGFVTEVKQEEIPTEIVWQLHKESSDYRVRASRDKRIFLQSLTQGPDSHMCIQHEDEPRNWMFVQPNLIFTQDKSSMAKLTKIDSSKFQKLCT